MRSPYIRLPLALLFVTPVLVAEGASLSYGDAIGQLPAAALMAFVSCLLGWGAYALYVRWIERRPLVEFGRAGALQELGAGLLFGALVFSLSVAALALFGAYRVTGTNPASVMWIPLLVAMASGTIEEIVMRGVIFRLLEESLGTWIALAISAAIFGLLHIANPGATLLAAIAIAFEAGLMLAAAYVLTRRLWLAIGIHAAWNFTQSGIYGIPTSGFPMKGVLESRLSGPAWLSGGAFGAEASVLTLIVCTAAGIVLLVLAHRRGHFIAPFWRRAPATPATPTGLTQSAPLA